jgi:hypothetical protein
MSNSTILATICNRPGENIREVKVSDYRAWLASPDRELAKENIAEMVYHRFYGRYLKPFSFPNKDYKKHYKHGFAMMATACLLIEALESFYQGLEETPRGENGQMFDAFFARENQFKELRGEPFYKNVRCGILHQAETTGGFTISRKSTTLFDRHTKKINAYKFAVALETSLTNYRQRLVLEEWDSEIWDNLRRKMRFLIAHC